MGEVYTNPLEKNDTNEANLERVKKDSLLEAEVENYLQQWIDQDSKGIIAVIQMDMDKSIEIRRCGISNKLQVLKEVAELLMSYEDENCKVIPHGTRDDVTILCRNITSLETEEIFVTNLLKRLEQTPVGHVIAQGPFHVTYSAGIAIYPVCGTKAADLLMLADGAVRMAKDQGRNSYTLAETGFHYFQKGEIDEIRWKKLYQISCESGKAMEELLREGYEELFQKHAALYRFCCQEKEEGAIRDEERRSIFQGIR